MKNFTRSVWNSFTSKIRPRVVGAILPPVGSFEKDGTLARVIQTSSGDRKIPVVTTHGSASWLDEEELVPESDEAFGQTSIGAFKLGTSDCPSYKLMGYQQIPCRKIKV